MGEGISMQRTPQRSLVSRLALIATVVMLMTALFATSALAGKPDKFDADGNVISFVGETGFDEWGYNYNAHMFSGGYCDAYQDAAWCQPNKDDKLIMKWDDAWLSNLDRDGDGDLDRHWGFDTYIGSGAWLTNHQSGEYLDNDQVCKWTYFVKIVAAPADAYTDAGNWYTVDDVEIGPAIWGQFAIIQEVSNDKCAGDNGMQYVSPYTAGLGAYSPDN